jgi:hypothetical protein
MRRNSCIELPKEPELLLLLGGAAVDPTSISITQGPEQP